jgi:putative hydrolase of the HAD superfamily
VIARAPGKHARNEPKGIERWTLEGLWPAAASAVKRNPFRREPPVPFHGRHGNRSRPFQAVIFDLWDTLADFHLEEALELERRIARLLKTEHARFHELWWSTGRSQFTGSIADKFRSIGAPDEALPELLTLRLEFFRRTLRPRPGAIELLRTLQAQQLRLGLITECSQEVPTLWGTTPFAGLFDSTVFSCSVGLLKPDPRIFLRACADLDVEPAECLFIGDGGNDELPGAARVGMTAVLLERPGLPSSMQLSWSGPRISSLADVLGIVTTR